MHAHRHEPAYALRTCTPMACRDGATIRLTVPGTLRYRAIAVRVVAEAARLVSGSTQRDPNDPLDARRARSVRHGRRVGVHGDLQQRRDPRLPAQGRRHDRDRDHADRARARDRDQRSRRAVRHRRRRAAADRARRASLPEGGMGIHIAKTMLDEVTYEPGPPNLWRLCKRLRLEQVAAPGGADVPTPFEVQRTSTDDEADDPRLARHQHRTRARRGDRQASSRRSRRKVVVDLAGARSDRQLRRRRARQALQGRPRGRRQRSRSPARAISRSRSSSCCAWTRSSTSSASVLRVLAITKIFPNAAEPLSAPFNRQQFAALARALRARGAGDDPVVPGRRACSRAGRAPASSRACRARETIDGHRRSRTRARCSCRGSRTATWGPLYAASIAPLARARIAARSTSCSARGRIPTGSRP